MQSRVFPALLTLRSTSALRPWKPISAPLARPPILCLAHTPQHRALHVSSFQRSERDVSKSIKASEQQNLDKEEAEVEDSIAQEKDKQKRAPWHREGSNIPPVARPRSAGAMTKGTMALLSLHRILANDPQASFSQPLRDC